jgi:hypothetical protein
MVNRRLERKPHLLPWKEFGESTSSPAALRLLKLLL